MNLKHAERVILNHCWFCRSAASADGLTNFIRFFFCLLFFCCCFLFFPFFQLEEDRLCRVHSSGGWEVGVVATAPHSVSSVLFGVECRAIEVESTRGELTAASPADSTAAGCPLPSARPQPHPHASTQPPATPSAHHTHSTRTVERSLHSLPHSLLPPLAQRPFATPGPPARPISPLRPPSSLRRPQLRPVRISSCPLWHPRAHPIGPHPPLRPCRRLSSQRSRSG